MNRTIQISTPCIGEEELTAVSEPLLSGWMTQGPKVAAFEEQFKKMHHSSHALACTSATTALHLILTSMGIGPGDEVIVPSFTWIATANVVEYCGATPVFVDIDIATYNIDPEAVAAAITERTKAVIAVHLFGLCAEMDKLREVCGDIPIVEDAACAAGSELNGKKAGSLGVAAAFSFHPRKIITTGEGGMITTSNTNIADKISCLRSHGASISEEQRHHGSQPYILPDFKTLGFNYRMTDIQAAVGCVQLSKLDKFINERAELANIYQQELSSVDWLQTPHIPNHHKPNWQAFICLFNDKPNTQRNEVMKTLFEKGISTRPGTHAIHTLDYYKNKYKIEPEDFPKSLLAAKNSMALPLHNKMDESDLEYIIKTIKEI